jgi:hypothetical protein
MSSHEGTPLTAVPGWTRAHTNKLAGNWITTAEQVVGMAATAQGVQTLAQQLGLSEQQMRRLVEQARAALPPAVAAELGEPVDTREYGLGALPPDPEP